MINLLPDERKRAIRAGRANRLLVRYLFLVILFGVIVAAFVGLSYFYLFNQKNIAEDTIAVNQAESAQLSDEQEAITEFEQNLAIAKDVLAKKIDYSGILLRYASVIPKGNVIESVTLDPSVTSSETTLNIRSLTDQAALNLKESMIRSPYFEEVKFVNLTRDNDGKYPIRSTMSLKIKQELLNE
ncbi:hypothetical protein CR983_01950 [Candidatus Saccharibacteria bacterium]|nr:MAG: hypothetical protein CR983_01950 [Candidatus Saccharibacteria bacterium]